MVELMITIVILGIASSLAIPSFQEFYANYRLRKASIDFMNALTLAKSESVRRGQQVNVDPIGGAWTNGWTVNLAPTTILQTFDPVTNIAISKTDGDPLNQISFQNEGLRNDHLISGGNKISFDVRFCDYRNRGRDVSIRVTGASNLSTVDCP